MDIVEKNLTIYDSIKSKGSPNTYTVLATINDADTGQLLAMASGTQACLRKHPNGLQDCHAESLAKRGYKRYLLNTLLTSLRGGCNRTGFEQVLVLEKDRNIVMFITQFPCGLIKRYEGEEPVNEITGEVIKRKPGRGVVKDGRTLYVEKDSCYEKLQKWAQTGLQGSCLGQLFGIKNIVKKLVIGNCEPDEDFNYENPLNQLKLTLPNEVVLVDNVRRDEFLYKPEKQPHPVALVAINQGGDHIATEYVVEGRKRGLIPKHYGSDLCKHKLSISNSRLREDFKLLQDMYIELQCQQLET